MVALEFFGVWLFICSSHVSIHFDKHSFTHAHVQHFEIPIFGAQEINAVNSYVFFVITYVIVLTTIYGLRGKALFLRYNSRIFNFKLKC